MRLDFSDLLGKGLSYDRVKGLLVANNGVYVTREPIRLTGPSSNLELDGTLDLESAEAGGAVPGGTLAWRGPIAAPERRVSAPALVAASFGFGHHRFSQHRHLFASLGSH